MRNTLYVGNLPSAFREADVRQAFSPFGTVTSARVVVERDGCSKGFGFVEMSTPQEAAAAMQGMNGKKFEGLALLVNEARPVAMHPRRTS